MQPQGEEGSEETAAAGAPAKEAEVVIRGSLEGARIVVRDPECVEWLSGRGFGEELEEGARVLYPYEALYLLGTERLEIAPPKRGLGADFEELLRLYRREDDLAWTRYLVYRDLRSRGYVVREGYGFKLDFRVYERGEYGAHPAKYVVYGVTEGEPVRAEALSELLRRVQSLRKALILAVVDRRSEVVYYTISRLST